MGFSYTFSWSRIGRAWLNYDVILPESVFPFRFDISRVRRTYLGDYKVGKVCLNYGFSFLFKLFLLVSFRTVFGLKLFTGSKYKSFVYSKYTPLPFNFCVESDSLNA